MNKITLNDTELRCLTMLLEYLSDSETRHYEESNRNDKKQHVYKYTQMVKSALKKQS